MEPYCLRLLAVFVMCWVTSLSSPLPKPIPVVCFNICQRPVMIDARFPVILIENRLLFEDCAVDYLRLKRNSEVQPLKHHLVSICSLAFVSLLFSIRKLALLS